MPQRVLPPSSVLPVIGEPIGDEFVDLGQRQHLVPRRPYRHSCQRNIGIWRLLVAVSVPRRSRHPPLRLLPIVLSSTTPFFETCARLCSNSAPTITTPPDLLIEFLALFPSPFSSFFPSHLSLNGCYIETCAPFVESRQTVVIPLSYFLGSMLIDVALILFRSFEASPLWKASEEQLQFTFLGTFVTPVLATLLNVNTELKRYLVSYF